MEHLHLTSGSAGAPKGDESDSMHRQNPGLTDLAEKAGKEKQQHDMVTDGWIGEPSFKGLLSDMYDKLGEKDLSIIKRLAAGRADIYWYAILALAYKLLQSGSITKKYLIHYLQHNYDLEKKLAGSILKE